MQAISLSGAARSPDTTRPQLVKVPPHPACDTIVAIPVRDEAGEITHALEALAQQTDSDGQPLDYSTYEVLVLANNCRDATVETARRFARSMAGFSLHVIDVSYGEPAPHAGRARRDVMDEASRRLGLLGRPDGIIATTDGDTRVAPGWIAATRAAIRHGADAVGGRIQLAPDALRALCEGKRRYHLQDVGYRSLLAEMEAYLDPVIHDPWPRHFQHFGASMAVTAAMYQRAGGLPVRPWLEDVAFHDRLVRLDARVRHSPEVQVTTSARGTGRASFGFSVQLALWDEMSRSGEQRLVEPVDASETRILARKVLRRAWHLRERNPALTRTHVSRASDMLAVDSHWLCDEVHGHPTFGSLCQAVERAQATGEWRTRWPAVDIGVAIQHLRYRLGALRRCQAQPLAPLEEVEPVRLFPVASKVL